MPCHFSFGQYYLARIITGQSIHGTKHMRRITLIVILCFWPSAMGNGFSHNWYRNNLTDTLAHNSCLSTQNEDNYEE